MPSFPITVDLPSPSPRILHRVRALAALVARSVCLRMTDAAEQRRPWETLNAHLLEDLGETPSRARLRAQSAFGAVPLGSLGLISGNDHLRARSLSSLERH